MKIKKLFLILYALCIILASCSAETIVVTESTLPTRLEALEDAALDTIHEYNALEVHFIDVGQGDCTLLLSDDEVMLIDCAEEAYGPMIQNYLVKQGVEKIDYLVLTHPDSDHIGGAATVITKFDIGNIYMPDYQKDTFTYEKLIDAMEYRYYTYYSPTPGEEISFGNCEVEFLGPVKEYEDPNNSSIVLKVSCGIIDFLFTGDACEEAEKDILEAGLDIGAAVYHVGHHGSSSSSSEAFVEAVSPIFGVISCAEGNDYGHPHARTLNTLRGAGTRVFRTDEQGSIIAVTNGDVITWNCSPSETWKAGEPKGTSASNAEKSEVPATVSGTAAYICNTNSMKFHIPGCEAVAKMSEKNRMESSSGRRRI